MKYEDPRMEASEVRNQGELTNAEMANVGESAEAAEQQLMDAASEQQASQAEMLEQQEMDEAAEKLGYSSSYYESRMASALESGNKIAYDNARRDWAKAKVKEST